MATRARFRAWCSQCRATTRSSRCSHSQATAPACASASLLADRFAVAMRVRTSHALCKVVIGTDLFKCAFAIGAMIHRACNLQLPWQHGECVESDRVSWSARRRDCQLPHPRRHNNHPVWLQFQQWSAHCTIRYLKACACTGMLVSISGVNCPGVNVQNGNRLTCLLPKGTVSGC